MGACVGVHVYVGVCARSRFCSRSGCQVAGRLDVCAGRSLGFPAGLPPWAWRAAAVAGTGPGRALGL